MIRPSASVYVEAVQSPALSFATEALRACRARANALGMPLSWSGSFATIFCLESPGRAPMALRCLTQDVPGIRERYRAFEAFQRTCPKALGDHLLKTHLLEQGILAAGEWHPVILMAWCGGSTLDRWVREHLRNPERLRGLQQSLRALAAASEQAGFIHVDLQHRNILVGDQGPVLVDYDNVSPPGCADLGRTTEGIAAFRHPGAGQATPLLAIDRFAYLILHLTLEVLIQAPAVLATRLEAEGLLFQAADLRDPKGSKLFRELRRIPVLASPVRALERVLGAQAQHAPALEAFLAAAGVRPRILGVPMPEVSGLSPAAMETLGRLYPRSARVAGCAGKQAGGDATPPAAPPAPGGGRKRWWIRCALAGLILILAWPARPALRRLAALPRAGFADSLRELLARASGRGSLDPALAGRVRDIRGTAKQALEERKDQLLALIINLDESIQSLQCVPDGVVLAVSDPATDQVRRSTSQALRRDLGETRETARAALLRCDAVLREFDALVQAPPGSPGELKSRLCAIEGLPGEARSRLALLP